MSAVGRGPEGRPAAKSTLGIQTDDLESGQDAVLGGINGSHPWMIASRPSDLDGGVTVRAPSPPKAMITAEVDEQVAGGRVPQAVAEEVESLSLPNSLGDAAASRPFLHQVRDGGGGDAAVESIYLQDSLGAAVSRYFLD